MRVDPDDYKPVDEDKTLDELFSETMDEFVEVDKPEYTFSSGFYEYSKSRHAVFLEEKGLVKYDRDPSKPTLDLRPLWDRGEDSRNPYSNPHEIYDSGRLHRLLRQ